MSQSEKLRVLLVVTKSNFGGAQRYVFEIADTLHKNGHAVAVASAGGTGELIDRLQARGITHLPIKQLSRDVAIRQELQAVVTLYKHVSAYKPDVVHLNSSKAGGLGAVVCRLLRVPLIIFTAHGWAHNEDRGGWWRSITYTFGMVTGLLVHKIITVSAYDYKKAPTAAVRTKCEVIHTGVADIDWIPIAAAKEALSIPTTNVINIGTVAELTANKNLLFAIDAVATFNQNHTQKLHYTIVGEGEDRAQLEKYITTNQLDCVTLAGAMPDARRYLKAFDVFMLPSRKEGLPYALLEAAAAGLPLIASDRGGISEVITNSTQGLLINPTDKQSLIAALKEITTAQKRSALGAAAHERSQHFTLDTMIEKTIASYGCKATSSPSEAVRATD